MCVCPVRCKFPYCGVPEPHWPPWGPASVPPPAPPAPPAVRLSCGVDNTKPCPLPTWRPTWDLARSTAIQPCNASGWYDPIYAAKWGLVSFDWSNAKTDWLAVSPHDCEERLVEQCQKIKTINPNVKCFAYRNTELALEWLTSQRAVMDEAHAGWFLNFQGAAADAKCKAAGPCTYSSNGGPAARPVYKYGDFCCPFANVYCENQDPWQGERQFFWDFTNSSLKEWWIDNFFLGTQDTAFPPCFHCLAALKTAPFIAVCLSSCLRQCLLLRHVIYQARTAPAVRTPGSTAASPTT